MHLEGLRKVLEANFAEIAAEAIICVAVAATILLEDQQNPVAVNFEGPPSSAKTTLVDFLDGAGNDKVYRSDKFTPKSFVSHSANVKREKLDEIDLLPRIRHRVFLVPELAPLFGLRNEDLLENFSILTRVLDGQGLTTDSGVHGQRGHTGDYLFAWIGCTTPIEHRVWKTMGKLGSRFLFFEMPKVDLADEELVADVAGGDAYRTRVTACREAVANFLDALWIETGGARSIVWDRAADPTEVMLVIAKYAKVLARLRGTISVWREGSGDDETYNFSTPVIEAPHRAMSLLYALARGHAIIHGRAQLSDADLPLVARAALESTPNDRRAVMRLLLDEEHHGSVQTSDEEHHGSVQTSDVQKALRCSAPTARAILETLDKLGLGSFRNPGPPTEGSFAIASDLEWLLDSIETKPTPCESDGGREGLDEPLDDTDPTVEDELAEAEWARLAVDADADLYPYDDRDIPF
jgi:hypothetical protein